MCVRHDDKLGVQVEARVIVQSVSQEQGCPL
jgi:hypothetical protein